MMEMMNTKIYKIKNNYMKTITLTNEVNQKLRAYIDNCEDEISGLGKIEVTEHGFLVTDVKILKQTVTGNTTDLDDDAIGKFSYELTKEKDEIEKWSLWWHSHADMKVFFSTTDTDTIEQSTDTPFLVSLVGNHANEWKARFDVFKPHHCTNELEVIIETIIDTSIIKNCIKEIKKLVKREQIKYTGFQSRANLGKQSHLPYDDDDLDFGFFPDSKEKLSAREEFLVEKAHHSDLTDKEAMEIAHLI